jgi:ATP-dependent DNA helicase PIF1
MLRRFSTARSIRRHTVIVAFTSIPRRLCSSTGTNGGDDTEYPADDVLADYQSTAKREQFVFNPFSSNLVRVGSPQIVALCKVGFTVAGDELIVGDAKLLTEFAKKIALNPADAKMGNEFTERWSARMRANLVPLLSVGELGAADAVASHLRAANRMRRHTRQQNVVGGLNADEVTTVTLLNKGQMRAIELAMSGRNVLICGVAGTGKTEVIKRVNKKLQAKGVRVGMTATTGLAAANIGGMTFHSCMGLTRNGEFKKSAAFTNLDALIIDEVSMLDGHTLDLFDTVLRRERNSTKPFGGMQLIICGDPLQLEPVNKTISSKHLAVNPAAGHDDSTVANDDDCGHNVGSSAPPPKQQGTKRYGVEARRGKLFFECNAFIESFEKIALTEQVRQAADLPFTEGLNQLRQGIWPPAFNTLLKHVDATAPTEAGELVLYSRNAEVRRANEERLAALPGEAQTVEALPQSPTLCGDWTTCAVLGKKPGFSETKLFDNLLSTLQQKLPAMRPGDIVGYDYLSDGFVLRVRIPANFDTRATNELKQRFADFLQNIAHVTCNTASLEATEDGGHGLCPFDVDDTLARAMDAHPVAQPLTLKVGAQVMLRCNLTNRLINGSIGVVTGFVAALEANVPTAFKLANEWCLSALKTYAEQQMTLKGVSVPLMPVVKFDTLPEPVAIPPCVVSAGGCHLTHHYQGESLVIPLMLAYASTIHKAQGMTVTCPLRICMEHMWGCNHIVYVAMSRVKSASQITVSGFKSEHVRVNTKAVEFARTIRSATELALTMEDEMVDVRADWTIDMRAPSTPAERLSRVVRDSPVLKKKAADAILKQQEQQKMGVKSMNASMEKPLVGIVQKRVAKMHTMSKEKNMRASRIAAAKRQSSGGIDLPPLMLGKKPPPPPGSE